MSTFTNYHVETAVGVIRCTFDTRAAAIAHAKAHAQELPGLRVVEVTTTTTRRNLWSNRHQLVGSVAR